MQQAFGSTMVKVAAFVSTVCLNNSLPFEISIHVTTNFSFVSFFFCSCRIVASFLKIGLLNPQTYMRSLHRFNATLQEYFHCMVGANIYLTPPNSQGFAPHYDDIEAFVLQIEGQKEWLLYPPRSADEVLPRTSSPDFRENELGEPLFRHILKPGDMLYFPRGWIHQARTVENQHSLHITLVSMKTALYFRFILTNSNKKNSFFVLHFKIFL